MKKTSINTFDVEKVENNLVNRLKECIINGDTLENAVKKSLIDTLVDNKVVTLGRKTYTYKGVTGTVKYLCDIFNADYHTVRHRLESGHSVDTAFTGKGVVRGRREGGGKLITFKGVTGNLKYLSEHFGLKYKTVHGAMRNKNWTEKESLTYYYNLKLERENK